MHRSYAEKGKESTNETILSMVSKTYYGSNFYGIDSCNEVCLKVISTVMYFTPIGVFCTIVPVVEANGTDTILSLATQLIILYAAFFGFAFIVYGTAVKVLGKVNPIRFFRAILPAALNAFGTCSSSATIPISKRCVEEELGVSNQISSIAVPLGATVNMDAVSIVMSFMIIFFANACGVNVSVSMLLQRSFCLSS